MDGWMGLLSGISRPSAWESRSVSAENPKGEKEGGARSVPPTEGHAASRLGKGWKARASITLPAHEAVTLFDVGGPAVLRHIWITVDPKAYRRCLLRFFWDGEATPSVEVPLGDFFCSGFGRRVDINSLPIAVCPEGGCNSYFPMPFRKHARVTIENQGREDISGFYYQFDYALGEVPADELYFHAQWRLEAPVQYKREYTILDFVKGTGHYVGTYFAWEQTTDGWWGEGEIKFYVDGDKEYPTICGTGTEDYLGGAWGFGSRSYSTAFLGYQRHAAEGECVPKHGAYRWHVLDPIHFRKDLRVTIQDLGWGLAGLEARRDNIASVAYWYQTEPHGKFPELPGSVERVGTI
ncbi:MAG: glycoside hydrolase family 172 protein [Planctomycetota bacterium]